MSQQSYGVIGCCQSFFQNISMSLSISDGYFTVVVILCLSDPLQIKQKCLFGQAKIVWAEATYILPLEEEMFFTPSLITCVSVFIQVEYCRNMFV